MKKNKSNPNYKSKNHSKYLLTYHFIFVCKYCKNFLLDFVSIIGEVGSKTLKKYIENQG